MNSIIVRPCDSPPVRVLEVDGPPRKYVQRGEGAYYLHTSNWPICGTFPGERHSAPDARLKDWDRPYWEVYQHNDGSIEIASCRPTIQEVIRGDLHGKWGSLIYPKPNRTGFRIALRIARRLCQCNPMEGITIQWYEAAHLWRIETDLPVFQQSSPGHSVVIPKSVAS